MKYALILIAAAAAIVATGCANPSRSRDVANPNVKGVVLAEQVCSNCHGLAGSSISPIFPNLAAQTPTYIASQLTEFRGHNRSDPAGFEYMWGLSRALTDQQIRELAEYYSQQAPRANPAHVKPDWVAAGDTIFHSGVPDKNIPPCLVCHGGEGQGNEQFPRLAGQHMDYVMKQLVVFQRSDERPEGAIMKTVAHELTEENIRDVAAYVQSIAK